MNKKIECHRCGYKWEYKGNKEYASCPNCYTKVKIRKYEWKSIKQKNGTYISKKVYVNE